MQSIWNSIWQVRGAGGGGEKESSISVVAMETSDEFLVSAEIWSAHLVLALALVTA